MTNKAAGDGITSMKRTSMVTKSMSLSTYSQNYQLHSVSLKQILMILHNSTGCTPCWNHIIQGFQQNSILRTKPLMLQISDKLFWEMTYNQLSKHPKVRIIPHYPPMVPWKILEKNQRRAVLLTIKRISWFEKITAIRQRNHSVLCLFILYRNGADRLYQPQSWVFTKKCENIHKNVYINSCIIWRHMHRL